MMTKKNLQLLIPVLLVFISLLLFETRDFKQAVQSPINISNLHKVIALSLANIYMLLFFALRGLPKRWTLFQSGFLLYILVGLFSSFLYSSNVMFSLWKLFEVLTVFMLSLYILALSRKNPFLSNSFYEICLLFFKFIFIVTIVGALIFPSEAIRSPLSEASMAAYGTPLLPYQIFGVIFQVNPNSLGVMSAIMVFVYVHRFMRGDRSFGVVMWTLFSLVFLIFSQSRTAFAGLLCAFAVTMFVDKSVRRTTKLFLIFMFLLFVVISVNVLIDYFTRGINLEQLETLSGRTIWWEIAIDEYLNTDVLAKAIGMGFSTASRTILEHNLGQGGASTLHSDYIDALVSTGLLGVVALSTAMIALFREVYRYARNVRNPIAIEMLGITTILFLRSFSGTTIATHNYFLILIFSVAVCLQTVKLRSQCNVSIERNVRQKFVNKLLT